MFFSWDKLIFKKYAMYQNLKVHVVLAPRNIGKTVATLKYLKSHNAFNENNKVVYFRNTKTELRNGVNDLKNWNKKLIWQANFIYDTKTIKLKDGDFLQKNNVVGYYASLNDYQNYKGLIAENVKYIFYDEFNEDTIIGKNLYVKFINCLKTFERFNQIEKIFIIGNKDAFNNDFFINWEILPNKNNKTDKITLIGNFGVCYDLGQNHFKNLKNNETIADKLANFNNQTANYLSGGYLKNIADNVINYKKILLDFDYNFTIDIDEQRFYFGHFKDKYAFLSAYNVTYEEDKKIYAINKIDGLTYKTKILNNADYLQLINFLYRLEKTKSIFYDSFDGMKKIRDCLTFFTVYLQNL